MAEAKKLPVLFEAGAGAEAKLDHNAGQIKWRRMLSELMKPAGLNTFEAQFLGDSCLATTVNRLQTMGLVVDRAWEEVNGRFGPVLIKRYFLGKNSENQRLARRLLGVA